MEKSYKTSKSVKLLTLVSEQSTENPSLDASFSPGLKRAMINKSIKLGAFCPHCLMAFPRYPGNYNHKCPICGRDVVRTGRLKELCRNAANDV